MKTSDVRYEQDREGWWRIVENGVRSQAKFADRVSAEISYREYVTGGRGRG